MTLTQKNPPPVEKNTDHSLELQDSVCSRCHRAFRCGAAAGDAKCWCFDMPTLAQPPSNSGCFCPACLAQMLAEQRG